MAEYYIRQPESDTARGPFDLQRIADLVEADQVDRETLYFDEDSEDWYPIFGNPDLRNVIFPDKKHIGLKSKAVIETLNSDEPDAPPMEVNEMLAAAEGKTKETKHLRKLEISRDRAAAVSLPALGVMMILSAAALLGPLYPQIQLIFTEQDYWKILQNPMMIVGCVDIFLALCCFLSVTDSFPLIRFRAMLGVGYFCYTAWAFGEVVPMGASAFAGVGIYMATANLTFPVMVAAAIAGIGGTLTLAIWPWLPS